MPKFTLLSQQDNLQIMVKTRTSFEYADELTPAARRTFCRQNAKETAAAVSFC